jgi:hypothetical protein
MKRLFQELLSDKWRLFWAVMAIFCALKLSAAVDELREMGPNLVSIESELRTLRETTLADVGENVSDIKDRVQSIDDTVDK